MADRVRTFTVAEANALLPRLNVILERQMALLREIDAGVEALRARGVADDDYEPAPGDDAQVAALKTGLREKVLTFRQGWAEVEATGAVVKDVRQGLIDFRGRRDGHFVWLCWRYGEPAVAFWHPMDQGFGSRQPLERESIPPTLN